MHESTLERDVARLRAVSSRQVWFGVDDDGGLLGTLHAIADDEGQLAAMMHLLCEDVEKLSAPVARPVPLVEAVVADLRAGRIDCHAAIARLETGNASLLPGLLHAMVRSLRNRHVGEGLGAESFIAIRGYHTYARCVFDVLCLVAQDLQGFMTQAKENDEARLAEARALAVWLRMRNPPAAGKT
ncbi:MAG: hypothetical protein ABIP94_20945 [Planctomycetota bacterium]